MTLGKKVWAVAEGYIPGWSNGPKPDFISHDAACILNASDEEAHVEITIYYTDREPVGPFKVTVAPRRSSHVRFNNFKEPEPIPLKTEYSSVFVSDVPIVLQYTRLDSRQAENALISCIAYAE